MDVNGQNNISIWTKVLKIVPLVMFVTLIFIVPYNNAYANLNAIRLKENEIILKDKVVSEKSIGGLPLDDKLISVDVFNSNMSKVFTINLKGHLIRLSDNTVGLTSLTENKYSMLEDICNSYINELEIDVNTITAEENVVKTSGGLVTI